MTYTTLSAPDGADKASAFLVRVAMLSRVERSALLALMERARRDPSYLPSMDDFKAEVSCQRSIHVTH